MLVQIEIPLRFKISQEYQYRSIIPNTLSDIPCYLSGIRSLISIYNVKEWRSPDEYGNVHHMSTWTQKTLSNIYRGTYFRLKF